MTTTSVSCPPHVPQDLGCANRATFVIDKAGKVVDTFSSPRR